MDFIRSRKHAKPAQSLTPQSLFALAVLASPLAGHAQTASNADQTLPEIRVRSKAEVPYKAEVLSSPKATQPLIDTPQVISVIKKELIQEQGATTIAEALRNTPGITIQLGENGNTSAGDTFQMRGFAVQSSIFVDGIRDLGAVTRDTYNIDQIEVVKGPAGSDIGRGAGAGYINLVTKLPSLVDANNGTVSWDTGNTKRLAGDFNKKIGEASAVRLNIMTKNGGIDGHDVVENKSYGVAPSLAFGLGTPTRLYLYSQHVRQDNVPDGGIPSIGLEGYNAPTSITVNNVAVPLTANQRTALLAAPRVNRENYYGSSSDYEKVDADMATAKIEHDFSKGFKLTNIARYGRSKMDRILTGVNAITATETNGVVSAPFTWTVARSRQSVLQENEVLANQTNLNVEFATGSIQHTLSTGAEMMYEKQLSTTRGGLGTIANANLYNPNPSDVVTALSPAGTGVYSNGSTTTLALYAFDNIKLNERFQLTGGLRFEHYKTDSDARTVVTAANQSSYPGYTVGQQAPSKLSKADELTSWKLGAIYKPAHNGSIYAAVANSFTPPGSTNFSLAAENSNINSSAMEAQKTSNIELGTKWDLLNKKLSLTAALYRTENKNELPQLVDAATNTYSQVGKRRIQGLELGAVGQITNAWQLSAGLATMNTKFLEGTTGNNAAGAPTRWSPKLTATLWSTYALNNVLTLGGGARYVSEQKRIIDPSLNAAAQSNVPSIPSYWVADAMASYNVTKNVAIRVNVYNLFDKFYVNTLNNGGSRVILGAPRSGMLSANFQF